MNVLTRAGAFLAFLVALFFSFSYGFPVDAVQGPFSEHTALGKRAALTYAEAVRKGKALKNAMNAGSGQSSSQFTRDSELETYGWEERRLNMEPSYGTLDNIFHRLGIDASKNQYIKLVQDDDVTVDDVDYTGSGGDYRNVFNTADGVIIADVNESPMNAMGLSKGDEECAEIVPLQLWSDVAFLEWQRLCSHAGKPVNSLKYTIRSQIDNYATKDILRQVCLMDKGSDDWSVIQDGMTFHADEEQFEAVLGTPNGRGLGYMLKDHKGQFGQMRVKELTVIGQKSGNLWYPMIIQETESF